MAFQLADHTGHGVGQEWGAVAGVIAVDGGDQPGPGGLDEILRGGPAAAAVAAGQPVGQAQVGQDDPLAQLGIAAGGVGLQPGIDLGAGSLVTGTDLNDGMVGKLGDGSRHKAPRGTGRPRGLGERSSIKSQTMTVSPAPILRKPTRSRPALEQVQQKASPSRR
jgi:hypothetical protein